VYTQGIPGAQKEQYSEERELETTSFLLNRQKKKRQFFTHNTTTPHHLLLHNSNFPKNVKKFSFGSLSSPNTKIFLYFNIIKNLVNKGACGLKFLDY